VHSNNLLATTRTPTCARWISQTFAQTQSWTSALEGLLEQTSCLASRHCLLHLHHSKTRRIVPQPLQLS
jgi:hypothetical protein